MWAFLIAGIVYLIGVAVVLAIRPSYMFTPDGLWKEFGIEKGTEYTLFPFWFFCIVWALVSYFLVIAFYKDDVSMIPSPELPKGYYVLNNKASRVSGVPKYVYLGEDASA